MSEYVASKLIIFQYFNITNCLTVSYNYWHANCIKREKYINTIIEQRKTISNSSNTSKVLLIILGVLVAIVIGFSSRAFGTNDEFVKWEENIGSKIEQEAKELLKKPSSKLSESVIDYFTQL